VEMKIFANPQKKYGFSEGIGISKNKGSFPKD